MGGFNRRRDQPVVFLLRLDSRELPDHGDEDELEGDRPAETAKERVYHIELLLVF